jgi:hypothetical protein
LKKVNENKMNLKEKIQNLPIVRKIKFKVIIKICIKIINNKNYLEELMLFWVKIKTKKFIEKLL